MDKEEAAKRIRRTLIQDHWIKTGLYPTHDKLWAIDKRVEEIIGKIDFGQANNEET